jgi:hypothetical protein
MIAIESVLGGDFLLLLEDSLRAVGILISPRIVYRGKLDNGDSANE